MIRLYNTPIFAMIGFVSAFISWVSFSSYEGIKPGFGLSQHYCERFVHDVGTLSLLVCVAAFILIVACIIWGPEFEQNQPDFES